MKYLVDEIKRRISTSTMDDKQWIINHFIAQ